MVQLPFYSYFNISMARKRPQKKPSTGKSCRRQSILKLCEEFQSISRLQEFPVFLQDGFLDGGFFPKFHHGEELLVETVWFIITIRLKLIFCISKNDFKKLLSLCKFLYVHGCNH